LHDGHPPGPRCLDRITAGLDQLAQHCRRDSGADRPSAVPATTSRVPAVRMRPRLCQTLGSSGPPGRQVFGNPSPKRRQHVHRRIDGGNYRCGTRPAPSSPYTLVLTKTDELFTGTGGRRRTGPTWLAHRLRHAHLTRIRPPVGVPSRLARGHHARRQDNSSSARSIGGASADARQNRQYGPGESGNGAECRNPW
jgi:hypothetical protein